MHRTCSLHRNKTVDNELLKPLYSISLIDQTLIEFHTFTITQSWHLGWPDPHSIGRELDMLIAYIYKRIYNYQIITQILFVLDYL